MAARQVTRLLTTLVLTALLTLGVAVAALAEGEGFAGTLMAGEDPIPGAEVVVRDADGNEVGRATSAEDGSWAVITDSTGQYQVELLTDTLPDGVELTDASPIRDVRLTIGGLQLQIRYDFDEAVVGASTGDKLVQNLFSGLKTGLIIAIAAVGLSLIFGTTGLINFAHGELVTFGAVTAWFLNTAGLELPIVLAVLGAVIIGGAFGGLQEWGMFARLRKRRVSGFQFLTVTIGLSLLYQSTLRLWFGNSFEDYVIEQRPPLEIGPILTPPKDVVVMVLALLVLLGVAAMLQLTRMGKAMRAVADNRDLAEASGIDVSRVILMVWVLGGSLATVGGVFQGITGNVHYLNGFKLLLLMFAAIILGGLGSAYGAIVGGIAVGITSEVSVVWVSSELKEVWALLILIGVLLVRPQGILGRAERLG